MSVVGYNHQDTEDCIGIEMEMQEGEPVACVYIGQAHGQTEITLDYLELCHFATLAKQVRVDMEWAMASYAFAREWSSWGTDHLVERGDICEPTWMEKINGERTTSTTHEKALCGRKAPVGADREKPRGWALTAVVGEPGGHCCKRCLAAYRKRQEAANGQ